MFILVDKPQGRTSFDLVQKVKRLYPEEKVWHGGTLDPLATWLLVIAVGKDTKKLDQLLWSPKTYITTIDFSVSTDTRDLDYRKEYKQWPVHHESSTINIDWKNILFPTVEQFHATLTSILGTHNLPLTPFSAKKIHWKKLYSYAREWTPIFLDVPMTLRSFQILDLTFPQLTVELEVGSGTYIRSIAYRLWKQFWLGWSVTMLRRIRVGNLSIPH